MINFRKKNKIEKREDERIYIIGSLRNPKIPILAKKLRELGFKEVFDDWYSPGPHADDYWRKYEKLRGRSYGEALKGWAGRHIFEFDSFHMSRSHIGILCMPCGKSGHLELGVMLGEGKWGYVYFDKEPKRWDVMYQFADGVFFNWNELKNELMNRYENREKLMEEWKKKWIK